MTTKTLKKLLKDYKLIYSNLGFKINPNFEKDFLHLKRMKNNSTKISFIKADKIKGLQENIKDFILKPNDTEQREKYFTAVKPSKILASLVLQPNDSKAQLFMQISEQFTKDFISNIKSKLVLFSGSEIQEQYYNNSTIVGCMSGSDKSFFKVYAKTENLQLATLKDESDTLLIRSLLWYDKEAHNYFLDNSYEQSTINGENDIRKEFQERLIRQVLSHLATKETNSNVLTFGFGCSFVNRLDENIRLEIEKDFNTKLFGDVKRKIETEQINTGKDDANGDRIFTEAETERSKNKILLKPIIKDFDYDNFDYFPYSDTFRSISKNSGKWYLNSNEGNDTFVMLTSQDGNDDNVNSSCCDCCGDAYNEEDVYYSDYEDEYLCDDCSVYIDERDVSVRREHAMYNDYSNTYHLLDDLREC